MTKKEKIQTELEQIQHANDGLLRAGDVVDFARANTDSALHKEFTWDVDKAARKRWLDEARQIIRVHVTMITNDKPEIRAYVSLQSDRRAGGGYRTVASVLSDTDRRAELLHQAVKELRTWQRKYQELSELASVFAEIERLKGEDSEAA